MGKRPSQPSELSFGSRGGRDEVIEETFTFQFLTPMQGGGVWWDSANEDTKHVKEHDAVTPVRGASVRGQLRFWWRATIGCKMASLKAMREAEGRIWGAAHTHDDPAATPPVVSLAVEWRGQTDRQTVFISKKNPRGVFNSQAQPEYESTSYSALGIQPKSGTQKKLADGVVTKFTGEFTVTLRYPQAAQTDVRKAVHAWALFGGLGSRTRRGFGAFKQTAPPLQQTPESFIQGLGNGATLRLVPSLVDARVRCRPRASATAVVAWKEAVGLLKTFRQGAKVGRNPGQQANRPGRSKWPEPDAIRRITSKASRPHAAEHPAGDVFPRAAFGMPIIFHFQDNSPGDPDDTTLKPAKFERMASPLILRPVADGGQYKAMAVVLQVPGSGEVPVVLATKGKVQAADVNIKLTAEVAHHIAPLKENPDVLGAFLDFFTR